MRFKFVIATILLLSFMGKSVKTNACRPQSPAPCPTGVPVCTKSVSVIKAIPQVFLIPTIGPGVTINIPVVINTASGTNPVCQAGNACTNPASVLGGVVNAILTPVVVPVPPGPGPYIGSAPLAPRPSGFQTGIVNVPVFIPGGTFGVWNVAVTATVNFSTDGSSGPTTLAAGGDAVICFVDPAINNPNLPRLGLEVIGNPLPRCPAGGQHIFEYKITNNDPFESVDLMAEVSSEQEAKFPDVISGDPTFIHSISEPTGEDDFPIAFLDDDCLIGFPAGHPNLPPLTKDDIILGPGESIIIKVAARSYAECGDGSCSQINLKLKGNFSNGDPALACASTGLSVWNNNPDKPEPEQLPDCDPVVGCTNPEACNYDPYAGVDDGSCIVPVPHCTRCNELGDGLEIIDSDGDGACNGRDLCPNDPDRGDITCGFEGDRIRMCFFKKIIGNNFVFVFAYSVCVSEEKAAELIHKSGWSFGYCGQNFHCADPGNPDDPIITDPTRRGEIGRIYEYEELQEILPLLEEDVNMKVFPNPVTDKGTIQFMLPETEKVSLKVYNMAGMEVARLYEGNIESGTIHEVNFDTGNLPRGVYFYKLTTASGKQLTCKVMISKY